VSFGPYFEKIYISFCIMTNQRDFWLIANLQQNLRLATNCEISDFQVTVGMSGRFYHMRQPQLAKNFHLF
jgi:hypothetical protein